MVPPQDSQPPPAVRLPLKRLWRATQLVLCLAILTTLAALFSLALPQPCHGPVRLIAMDSLHVPRDWPSWPIVAEGTVVESDGPFFCIPGGCPIREVWRFGPYQMKFSSSNFKGHTSHGPILVESMPSCGSGVELFTHPNGHPGADCRLRRNPHTGNMVYAMEYETVPEDPTKGVSWAYELIPGATVTEHSATLWPFAGGTGLILLVALASFVRARPLARPGGRGHWPGATISVDGSVTLDDGVWLGDVATGGVSGRHAICIDRCPAAPPPSRHVRSLPLRVPEAHTPDGYRATPRRVLLAAPGEPYHHFLVGRRRLLVSLVLASVQLFGAVIVLVAHWL